MHYFLSEANFAEMWNIYLGSGISFTIVLEKIYFFLICIVNTLMEFHKASLINKSYFKINCTIHFIELNICKRLKKNKNYNNSFFIWTRTCVYWVKWSHRNTFYCIAVIWTRNSVYWVYWSYRVIRFFYKTASKGICVESMIRYTSKICL